MSMKPLLVELGVEELPVKALPGLAQAFFDGVVDGLARRGIAFERGDAKPLSTPRRLAVLLPGVASASGIMLGYALGYRRFKLFPAEVCGGVAALKALGGPFGNIRFCPTGGVNARNARDYLAQSNVMCVGGTWMVDAKAVRAGDWAAIESATRQALQALDSAAPAELPRDFDLRAERAEQREL